ncbi:MAG: DUF6064 family protein [Clostridia bacterium]|nr:DUF6064 family protein [Clostridia bacterium]
MNSTLYVDMCEYNKKVFPAQIIMVFIGTASSLFLFLNPGKISLLYSLFSIVLFYLWVGITYPFLFKGLLKRSKVMIIVVFINLILGILLAADIFFLRGNGVFVLKQVDTLKISISVGLVIWGILIHPIEGVILRGHKYAAYLGVYTCPTAPYAIGILSAVHSNSLESIVLIVISCIAIATGITAGLFGMKKEKIYEDIVLIPVGLYGLLSVFIM